MNDECGGQTVYMQPITTQLKGQHFNVATKKKVVFSSVKLEQFIFFHNRQHLQPPYIVGDHNPLTKKKKKKKNMKSHKVTNEL